MKLSKCSGCMEPFQGYPCPVCGFDPQKVKGTEYALPIESILAGKYLIGRVLGQGGFGITYIGWDIALERKVAIKEYFPAGQVSRNPGTRELTWYTSEQANQAQQSGMQMFLKEARKMVRVDGVPNVVRVLDLFQENGTAYIVMEFVEGETLKARLTRTGPLPWSQAKTIFQPAIHAMAQVHKAGLVHRDISPDNLMLTPDGDVRVLDLGAAKDLSLNSGASSMQVAKGGFSPLEQYIQRGNSGPWTDVYAMGATIYYTLTGKLPPSAVDRLNEDTISWKEPGLSALSPAALAVLQKAMAVQASNRIQSMEELERGLFSAAAAKPANSNSPAKGALASWNWKKAIIPAAAAVVLLIAGIVIGTQTSKSGPATEVLGRPSDTFAVTAASSSGSGGVMRTDSNEIQWLDNTNYVQQRVFGSNVMRNEVASITFLSDRSLVKGDVWDISEQGDNSVVAGLEKNGSMYDLYIAADGGVKAPQYCGGLFALYDNVTSINFNNSFDTSNAESMEVMFLGCKKLKQLDLSSFNTQNVTDMSNMLNRCESLTDVDLSSFRTQKVMNYDYMFWDCTSLRTLDLSSFSFASGASTCDMLGMCGELKSLRANGMALSEVTGYWDDTAVKLGNSRVHPYVFYTELIDCTQMTVSMTVTMKSGAKSKEWKLWGRVNGSFEEIGKITLPDGDGSTTKTVFFDKPLTVDAIVAQPSVAGGYSWSMDMGVTDAYVGTGA